MVTVDSYAETIELDLGRNSIAAAAVAVDTGVSYPQCRIIFLECSFCGNFVGARDGYGFSGISECVCPDCQESENRLTAVAAASAVGRWHYRVPCAGVRYYGFDGA